MDRALIETLAELCCLPADRLQALAAECWDQTSEAKSRDKLHRLRNTCVQAAADANRKSAADARKELDRIVHDMVSNGQVRNKTAAFKEIASLWHLDPRRVSNLYYEIPAGQRKLPSRATRKASVKVARTRKCTRHA
jgi:predicted DCC family thiol-disulfide oxidoreductase YuxK